MGAVKNLLYGYVIGDSFGLGRLNNENIDDNVLLKDNLELNIAKGNYSYMTVSMLSIIDSLTFNKKLNICDILNKMCTSLIVGKYTSDGKIYDLDNNILNILRYYNRKNNLDIEYDELDYTSYCLSGVLPIVLFNYYKEDNIDNLISVVSLINVNDTVLLGAYIYYSYIFNLLKGYDKCKALYKIEIPDVFDKELVFKFKNILKGNIYYKEIVLDDNIVNVLSVVFYVILNSKDFNDIFVMLNNISGNTNIYSSLVCSVGGLLYDIESIDKKIWNDIKNKTCINKHIRRFERMLKR